MFGYYFDFLKLERKIELKKIKKKGYCPVMLKNGGSLLFRNYQNN